MLRIFSTRKSTEDKIARLSAYFKSMIYYAFRIQIIFFSEKSSWLLTSSHIKSLTDLQVISLPEVTAYDKDMGSSSINMKLDPLLDDYFSCKSISYPYY